MGELGELHIFPDLSAYTDRQRDDALARARCVESYRAAKLKARTPERQWLPLLVSRLSKETGLRFTDKSLRRWERQYQRPADLVKLIDRRGRPTGGSGDPAAWAFFRSIFLDDREPSLRVCWERTREAAEMNGWAWCGLRACYDQLDQRIPPDLQMQFRRPKEWRDRWEPTIQRNPEQFAANACWVGDHCQLDLICRFPNGETGRPYLTAWMDDRSRRLVGWRLVETPCSATIMAAFRDAVLDEHGYGSPQRVHIDNGRDYAAVTFTGQTKAEQQAARAERRRAKAEGREPEYGEADAASVFKLLQIDAHFALPYNPRGKSKLERWFQTLHDQFDKTFKTYCGRTPSEKPEGLAGALKNAANVPTFEHVRERLADFIAVYNATPSTKRRGAEGLTPDEAMVRLLGNRRKYPPGVLNLALGHWKRSLSVGKNGITLTIRGQGKLTYGQFDPRLQPYKRVGRAHSAPKVRVRYDPEHLNTIQVFDDETDRFIGEIEADNLAGVGAVSEKDVAEAIKKQRRYKAARREVAENAHHEYLSTNEHVAHEAAKRRVELKKAVGDGVPLVPVESDVARQMAATLRPSIAPAPPPRKRHDLLDLLGKADQRHAENQQAAKEAALQARRADPGINLDDLIEDSEPLDFNRGDMLARLAATSIYAPLGDDP